MAESTRSDDSESSAPRRLLSDIRGSGHAHPAWWHPYLVGAWVAACGIATSAAVADPVVWVALLLVAVAAVAGTVVGAATVDVRDASHMRLMYEAGALGTATGAAAAGWCWWAAAMQLHADMTRPVPWVALLAGTVCWAAAYTALRLRLEAARDPQSHTAQKLKQHANGGVYEQAFADTGFGSVTVVSAQDNWAGERVIIELDEQRNDTYEKVQSKNSELRGALRREFKRQRGIRLPTNAIQLFQHDDDEATFTMDVTLRHVLRETIEPAHDVTVPVHTPGTPLQIGAFASGDALTVSESGQHGVSIGSTGSGKSTYYRALVTEYSRRSHVLLGCAGTSKFTGMVRPFLAPLKEGATTRLPYALAGGPDFDSALRAVQTAYMLYAVRDNNPDIPRDDGGNLIPSAEYPVLFFFIDELDDLVLRGKEGTSHTKYVLPNGEKRSIPDMLSALTSKGRSEGVNLEMGSQSITDDHNKFGMAVLLRNVHRRALFKTLSNYDAKGVIKGTSPDVAKMENHTLYFNDSEQPGAPAKVAWYGSDLVRSALIAAERNGTLGALSAAEATAIGELWTQRWSRDRAGGLWHALGLDPQDLPQQATASTATASTATSAHSGGSAPQRSSALSQAVARAQAEMDGNEDSTLSAFEREAQRGIAQIVSSGGTLADDDGQGGDILTRVLAVMGTRDWMATADILHGLGRLDDPQDTDTLRHESPRLRDELRQATGDAALAPRQAPREHGRRRMWHRPDLDGTHTTEDEQ